MKVVNIDKSSNITGINQFIICNSNANINISLTRSALGLRYWYIIKNLGLGDVTVTPVLNDLIDGQTTKVLAQYESIQIVDYNTNNWIITYRGLH